MESSEAERRKLNRKVMKMTFQSEFKKREKSYFIDFLINFISVLLGVSMSELVIKFTAIDGYVVNLIITTLITFVFITVFSLLRKRTNWSQEEQN